MPNKEAAVGAIVYGKQWCPAAAPARCIGYETPNVHSIAAPKPHPQPLSLTQLLQHSTLIETSPFRCAAVNHQCNQCCRPRACSDTAPNTGQSQLTWPNEPDLSRFDFQQTPRYLLTSDLQACEESPRKTSFIHSRLRRRH